MGNSKIHSSNSNLAFLSLNILVVLSARHFKHPGLLKSGEVFIFLVVIFSPTIVRGQVFNGPE